MLRGLLRNKRVRFAANIVLCAVFVGLVASLGMPAVYEICGPNEYTHAKECAQYHLPQFLFLWAVGIGDTHNGLITAIATVLLTGITIKLARLEQESGDTQRAELRAYISAITKGITVAADRETVTFYVEVRNAGLTPAFNLMVPCGITVQPPDKVFQVASIKITNKAIKALPPVTLAKDQGCVPHAEQRFTYSDCVRFMSSPHRVYFFGLITYQDIFGLTQWVEFCHYLDFSRFSPFLDAAKSAPDNKVDITFKSAPFGNDTSLNPQHVPRMRDFWASFGRRP